jgi:hypothetical protein
MTEFVTTDNATVFFLPKDIRDYLAHGDVLWTAHTANWEPAQKRSRRFAWPAWVWCCQPAQLLKDSSNYEQLVADLLEWGRSEVDCPICEERWEATELSMTEESTDGIDHRQFYCPMGHCILLTKKYGFGEFGVCLGNPLPLPNPPFGRYFYVPQRAPLSPWEKAMIDRLNL